MKLSYSTAFLKRSLSAHSWVGLLVAALMYLICLSGAICVFSEEFERWEQPYIHEFQNYDAQLIENAYQAFIGEYTQETEHIHIVFARPELPRIVVENDHLARFVNQDGSLGEIESPVWTKMLTDLHLHLHLPSTIGLIVVSAFGVLLFSLIVSGFLAHPGIFKDAFHLRRGNNQQLQHTDLHNRLSVWAAPFHLMISLTGAYFGLAGLIVVVAAKAFFNDDRQAVLATVFGDEPTLIQPVKPAQVGRAIDQFKHIAPGAQPLFLTIHKAGTAGQFIEFYVKQPGRLIYSENFRFDANGNYLGRAGFSDGPPGKQVIYSIYRLHFGNFAGLPMKIVYFISGLALSVVCATGVNIWLAKRSGRDYINDLWAGFLWSTPLALALSALVHICVAVNPSLIFWLILVTASLYAVIRKDVKKIRWQFQRLTGISLFLLVAGYSIRFYDSVLTPAATGVNAALVLTALLFLFISVKQREHFFQCKE